jgi:hypothetical protein
VLKRESLHGVSRKLHHGNYNLHKVNRTLHEGRCTLHDGNCKLQKGINHFYDGDEARLLAVMRPQKEVDSHYNEKRDLH